MLTFATGDLVTATIPTVSVATGAPASPRLVTGRLFALTGASWFRVTTDTGVTVEARWDTATVAHQTCAECAAPLLAEDAATRPDDNPDYCAGCNAAWWAAVLA